MLGFVLALWYVYCSFKTINFSRRSIIVIIDKIHQALIAVEKCMEEKERKEWVEDKDKPACYSNFSKLLIKFN